MQITEPRLDELATFAASLADLARPVARSWFRRPVAVETKPDASPVTQADREIEALLRRALGARFPSHGVVGEEFGSERPDAEFVWVLDPIDGTKSFITGMPTFGTLIALLWRGRPVVGVVDMPALDERWTGCAGRPTRFNGAACRVRAGRPLGETWLYATSPDQFGGADRAPFETLSRAVRMRRFGGDCYGYGLLASGWIDAVVDAATQPYDYLPLVPVVEGAGGVISDWAGRPLGLASDGRVLAASTPALHAAMLDRLDVERRAA